MKHFAAGVTWTAMLAVALIVCALSGCHASKNYCQRSVVSSELETRVGQPLGQLSCPGETTIPPAVDIADGVTEDEAIAFALWNNAAYLETLSQLGISEAQLFDAGLLQDPQLIMLFPLGPKQFEFTAFQFVDALWLRPIRVRAAELGLCRVADQMVQNGLDVVRDVRLAHADLLFTQQSADLAVDAKKIRGEIADLAQKRLDAGDISELEASDSRVQELAAKADAARAALDVSLAQKRLLALMGLADDESAVVAVDSSDLNLPARTESELVREAFVMRPDLRASEIGIAEAVRRLELAETQFLSFEAGIDANSDGSDGFEASPAVRMTLPIFNRNRGNITIAQAQLEQAQRRYDTVRDRIALDVRQSFTTAQQAHGNLQIVTGELLPTLKTAVELARKNYLDGGTSYFLVLQTTSQFLDARTRELRLSADLRRAVAELERSVGHRFVTNPEADRQSNDGDIEPPVIDQIGHESGTNRTWAVPAVRQSIGGELAEKPTIGGMKVLSSDE